MAVVNFADGKIPPAVYGENKASSNVFHLLQLRIILKKSIYIEYRVKYKLYIRIHL